MTTYPERILEDRLKLYRGNSTMTAEEIAAETMVRLAQEGWKFIPAVPEDAVLAAAGIDKKTYLVLYSALKER